VGGEISVDEISVDPLGQDASTPMVQVEDLLESYKVKGEPIQVNFRSLVSWIPYGERASHMIHLYPAKLLPHIPAFFLQSELLSEPGDLVLDPFSGSGTVALETILAGRVSVTSDSNPLARLITKVKTTRIPEGSLRSSLKALKLRIESGYEGLERPDVVNLEYWFYPHVIDQLSTIKKAVSFEQDRDIRELFQATFSNTIKRVSLADPRMSVPVRLKLKKYKPSSPHYEKTDKLLKSLETVDVFEVFYRLLDKNIKRALSLNSLASNSCPSVVFDDARNLGSSDSALDDESVQLVITSPPYAGAQKYIRSSGLNLGWLDFCPSDGLRHYEKLNIGREHHSKAEYSEFSSSGISEADSILSEIFKENPLRAYIASKYLVEMRDAFSEVYRVLKRGGYFVLVSSANEICGVNFETHKYLSNIFVGMGASIELRLIDDIHSRGLMTKRNKTSSIISCEWVYIFRKN